MPYFVNKCDGQFFTSVWLILGYPVAAHSSTFAWKIPWTEEPGGLQSMGSLRVGQDWATSLSLFTFMHWRRKWQPTPVFLPGESQGWGSLVGCVYGVTQSRTRLKWLSSSSRVPRLNVIWGYVFVCFQMRLAFELIQISKVDWLPHCEWGSFNPSRPWRQQNAEGKICPFLLDCSSWNISLLLLVLLVLRPSDQGKNQFPWFSGLWTWTDYSPTLQGLQLADCRLWDFLASICNSIP